MAPEALRYTLLEMLAKRLIPATCAEELPLVFMEPSGLLKGSHEITLHPGKPLRDERQARSRLYLNRWPEAEVHAVRYPYLAAVVEGEIDWRIGITQKVAQQSERNIAGHDYMIVPVREDTFFFMPPGVAYSDGSGFHWERAEPKVKEALLFSMLILPAGFMCHFCRSSNSEHVVHQQIFVSCPQIQPLARMMEEELLLDDCDEMVVRGQLQSILGYARRALQKETIIQPKRNNSTLYGNNIEVQNGDSSVLEKAKNHIEMNLRDALTPDSIAAQVYISARQLDRYFRRELNLNIMGYVTNRRVEAAQGLLLDTDLSVKQIGTLVGYSNPSSFVQVFKRQVGVSPNRFREKSEHTTQ